MSKNIYQKTTNNGRPVVNNQGLPVFVKSVNQRIKTVREILTIGMNDKDAKWFNVQSDCNSLVGV